MTDKIFVPLVNMSITASWLILAVCILRLTLRKAPKNLICLLWALVAIRLVCPFTIESALSLVPTKPEILTDALMFSERPTVETGIEVIDQAIAPSVSESLTPYPGASVNPIQVYTSVGAVLWEIGMAVLILYALYSTWRLRRRVAASIHIGQSVFLCDNIDTPFILGIIRPRIYLPSTLSEVQQRHVLAHEWAHIRRRDHLWKPLGYLILTLHWFNPLCWLAYTLFCRDIELACDEKVIRSGTLDYKKEYSKALLACSLPQGKKVFCPLAFGEVGVKTRIRSVLQYKKPAFWVLVLAVLACIAAVIFFMTDPLAEPDESVIIDRVYEPFQNIYASPPLTESDYETKFLPLIYLDKDDEGEISFCLLQDSTSIEKVGHLEEWRLTREDFDALFREQKKNENGPWSWPEDESWFRRENYKAWRVVRDDIFYILLLQRDGSVLLCHGYYDAEGETDPYSDDSSARWMVLLNPIDDPFARAKTPYQWTNNITAEQVEWVSVTVWEEEPAHELPDAAEIEQLTAILRRMTPEQVYESDPNKQHLVSVMVHCYGREYLLQYVGDGIIRMTFDTATADLYGDKNWVIEDEVLGRWMEQWLSDETIDSVEWQYQPQLSSRYPAFPVFFGFDYTSMSLSGPNGTRQMIIGGVVGNNNKVYAGGNGFCWSPMTEGEDAQKELIALTSEIRIAVTDKAGETYHGTLYFEVNDLPDGDPNSWADSAASSLAFPVYTIWLESEELHIAENPYGESILLQKSK